MSKEITPCLWFVDNAEEALNFYTSLFPNSSVTEVSRYGDAGPGIPGTLLTATFTLNGRSFQILNGGDAGFAFSEAISFSVRCETQAEVDELWDKLTSNGGEESQCGWCKDRFGISWQIVPQELVTLLQDPDQIKAQRVMMAMLEMNKIDTAVLRRAYDGE